MPFFFSCLPETDFDKKPETFYFIKTDGKLFTLYPDKILLIYI